MVPTDPRCLLNESLRSKYEQISLNLKKIKKNNYFLCYA